MNEVIPVKPWYKRSKLWAAGVAVVIVAANNFLGLGFTSDELMYIVAPLIAYVFGEAGVDMFRNFLRK